MSKTPVSLAETIQSVVAQTEHFLPRRFLRNGHLQTLVANYKPRQYVLPEAEAHLIEVEPGTDNDAESGTVGLEEARANVIDALRLMLTPDDGDPHVSQGRSEPLELIFAPAGRKKFTA